MCEVRAMEAADLGLFMASILLGYVVLQQIVYWSKKKHIPGPVFVFPFLGGVISMVRDPAKYWDNQALASRKSGLSCNLILGRFVLFIRDSELSQKVFANVKPEAFHLVGHPFGKRLFGENNLIFMFGEEHKDLRRRLAPLFTHKALSTYVAIQEKTVKKHIEEWLAMARSSKGPLALRNLCRDMNLETSQNVFIGPYLTPKAREQFTRDYNLFNVGLMALPLNIPGCAFYKATHAVKRLVSTLSDCARESKKKMAEGGEPACLMDYWTAEILKDVKEAEESGLPTPPHSSDGEVGHHVFDFLFAAQDASTSSLVWAVTLLESHPEVLAKVRAEQKLFSIPYTPEQLRDMKYTEMVVKEVLRIRPPATLVPHIASSNFPITETYRIPEGTIVFPSVFESSFQGFTDPYTFDPDRFSPQRLEDHVYKRNWLTFGAGSHQCLGQRYAINQLILFTAILTTMVEFTRSRTPDSDDIVYTPTIAPKDHCLLFLSERKPV